MTPVSVTNNKAALLLIQQNPVMAIRRDAEVPRAGVNIAAIANGFEPEENTASSSRVDAQVKITENLFDAKPSLTAIKIDLFDRVGEALGVKKEDHETSLGWARAMRSVIHQIMMRDDGDILIMKIEENLGLDKLGISLLEVVDAVEEPGGQADKKLDAALAKQFGDDHAGAEKQLVMIKDAIGLYRAALR